MAALNAAFDFDPTAKVAPSKLGCNTVTAGTYFDAQTRRLYVAGYQADDSITGLAFS